MGQAIHIRGSFGKPLLSELYADSPTLWARDRLSFIPDPLQQQFLDCQDLDIILNWCRQSGKTTCGAIKVAHAAKFHDNHLSLIVSSTQRQAGILQRRVLNCLRQEARKGWRETRAVELPSDPMDENSRLIRCSVLSLELANGSEVVSVPASPDTVRGYSPNCIVLDEAARIKDDTIDAIRPMRAARAVQLVALSTPAGRRGFFYREWSAADSVWTKSAMDADLCPRISEEFLERERKEMSSEAMFSQEYYLEFVEMEGSIFKERLIDDMLVRVENAPLKPWAQELVVAGEVYR